MFHLLSDPRRSLFAAGALGVAAVTGWGGFAYEAATSGRRLQAVAGERDAAVAERRVLVEKAGDLTEVEARIASARAEHGRAVQALADARARAAVAQQELAAAARRADLPADRVSQTGSIRQPEPPKRPAR